MNAATVNAVQASEPGFEDLALPPRYIAYEIVVDGYPIAFVRDCAGNLIEILPPLELPPPAHSGSLILDL